MTTEEEKLYLFLGEEANFENALLVQKHMPAMRQYLLDTFWKIVMKRVDELRTPVMAQWQMLELEHQKQWWSLHLVKTTWPEKVKRNNLSIRWSELARSPHLGVWVRKDADCFNWSPFINDVAALKEKFAEKRQDLKIPVSYIPEWWPILFQTQLDLSGYDGLKPILPSNRDALATSYAQLIVDLVEAVDEPLDELVTRHYQK